jgi:hypothetical protein
VASLKFDDLQLLLMKGSFGIAVAYFVELLKQFSA